MTPDQHPEHGANPEDEGVRVTDRRRIDPETGSVRQPPGCSDAADVADPAAQAAEVLDSAEAAIAAESAAKVAELTADLQRLAAEYKNYRERVQREIAEAQARGRTEVVNELIATLDDLDRAAEHGELEGPVKALADNLAAALGRLGVERYGTEGEPFDQTVHEAMTHAAGEGLEGPIVAAVYQPGYRIGERIVRPARVAVAE